MSETIRNHTLLTLPALVEATESTAYLRNHFLLLDSRIIRFAYNFFRMFMLIIVGLEVFLLVKGVVPGANFATLAILLPLGFFGRSSLHRWYYTWTTRDAFRKLREVDKTIVFEFSEAEVQLSDATTTSICQWDHFKAVAESTNGYVLLSRFGGGCWVAASGFASPVERDRFVQLAETAIPYFLVRQPVAADVGFKVKQTQHEL